MTIFRVTSTGTDAVSDTFKAVSAFVKSAKTNAEISKGIHLGDYIDLPSLTVAAYGGEGADFGEINVTNANLGGTKGYILRIIVVGINSFNSNDSTNTSYSVTDNDDTPHVVFQFQNLPGTQKMNPANDSNPNGTNEGGYAKTLMRKYLVTVDDVGGNFLAGLKKAGVPAYVLWGPMRSLAINYDDDDTSGKPCNVIEDLLWLPTAWEMFGTQSYSAKSEKAANQARLEYYTDEKRVKYNMSGTTLWSWDASPYYDFLTSFCVISRDGGGIAYYASSVGGVAPAFCVK
jgi:hypothetical protein